MIADFRLMLVSSVGKRNGMALELTGLDGDRIAEVFQDEDSGVRTITVFGEIRVPIEAIGWLTSEARIRT
jgi:hypothetical protein